MACAAVYGRVAGGRRPQDRLAGRVGQRDASHCERKAASVYSHDRRLYRVRGGGGAAEGTHVCHAPLHGPLRKIAKVCPSVRLF